MNSEFTLQLSTGGTPSAWDLSPSGDGVVVAAPGCLTFFKLNGLGTPRQVIHYEQPQQIRKVTFQKQGGSLISALRAGVVSLWDPMKTLRPLLGHVNSQGGWITDLSWSPKDVNLLVTSCDAGKASVWDVRTPSWPVQQVNAGGVCSYIDWCPHNANLISVLAHSQSQSGQRLIIFDNRMVGSSNLSRDSVTTIEMEGGVIRASWFAGAQQPLTSMTSNASACALVLGSGTGRLGYWDILVGTENGCSSLRSSQFANLASQSGGALIDTTSQLLATPLGRGAVVCRRIVNTAVNDQSKTGSPPLHMIRLQGCPRDSLLNAFAAPDTRPAKVEFEYGPSIDLGQGFASPVLEMKWGTPGRLVPPAHGGMELLVLTESSCLTALRIPMDLVRKFCFPGEQKPSGGSGNLNSDQVGDRSKGGTIHSNIESAVVHQLISGPTALGASRHPLSSLKSRRGNNSVGSVNVTPLSPTRGEQDPGGVGGNLSMEDRGGDRFWASIRGEVLALEDAVGRNLLPGLSISRIDQYARQVTIEVELPRDERHYGRTPDRRRRDNFSSHSLDSSSRHPDSVEARVVALIVRYPSRGVPSFAIRGFEGADEAAAGTEIIAELDVIAVTYFGAGSSDYREQASGSFQQRTNTISLDKTEDGFLLAVAHSIRNRCAQPLVPRAYRKDGDGADVEGGRNAEQVDEKGYVIGDEAAKEPNNRRDADNVFIDPIAYRVPSPSCSGGRWSAKGVLVCFGGAVLMQCKPSVDGSGTNEEGQDESEGLLLDYPKSLGDMLIMERAREEAYAQQMAYLKQMQLNHSSALDEQDSSDRSDSDGSSSVESDSDNDSQSGVERSSSGPDLVRSASYRSGGSHTTVSKLPFRTSSFESVTNAIITTTDISNVQKSATSAGPLLGPVPMNRSSSGLSTGSGKVNYSGLDEHLLPLLDPTLAGQTLESLGEDLDLIAKATARTAGFRRSLPLAGNNNERTMWLAAAAAASTSAIMSNAPTQLAFYQALSTLPLQLADQYSLGPVPRQSETHPVTPKGGQRRNIYLDVKARASACRRNAEVATRLGRTYNPNLPYSVQQIWSLLAVSLDLYSAAQDNPDGLASEGGALLCWADSVLGCGLLRRVLLFLAHHHNVQLLATCVCVLGGPAQTIALMNPHQDNQELIISDSGSSQSLSNSQQDLMNNLRGLLDRALACYADILCRWGALTKAVEVSKHNTAFSQMNNRSLVDRTVIGVGVTCSRCSSAASVKTTSNNSNIPAIYWCTDCRDFAVYCAICMTSVRGTAFFCASCGHGGHPEHVKTWFEHSVECPTGCGCRCAELGVSHASSFAKQIREASSGDIGSSADEDTDESDNSSGSEETEGDEDDQDYGFNTYDFGSPTSHYVTGWGDYDLKFEESARAGLSHLYRD